MKKFEEVDKYMMYYKKNKGETHHNKSKYFSWKTIHLPNKIYIIKNDKELIPSYWELRGVEFNKDFRISGLRLFKKLENSKLLYGDYLHRANKTRSLMWLDWSNNNLTVVLCEYWYPENPDLRSEYLNTIYEIMKNNTNYND